MSVLPALPRWAYWLVWLLIAVIVIILFALVVHALGGFDWSLHIGHFHLQIGVS